MRDYPALFCIGLTAVMIGITMVILIWGLLRKNNSESDLNGQRTT